MATDLSKILALPGDATGGGDTSAPVGDPGAAGVTSNGYTPATPGVMAGRQPVLSDFDTSGPAQPQPQQGGGYWWPQIAQGALSSVKSGLTLPGDVATGKISPQDPNFTGRVADMAGFATGAGAPEGAFFSPLREAVTPADVTANAAAKLADAEEALQSSPLSSHDLGFEIQDPEHPLHDTKNPTVQDLLDYKTDMEKVKPEDDPMGGTRVILQDINKALAEGTPMNKLVQAHQDALDNYNSAVLAQTWMDRTGLVGGPQKITDAAQAEMEKYPPGSAQGAPYKAIGSVPVPIARPPIGPGARATMGSVGGAIGGGISHFLELSPHETAGVVVPATVAGSSVADAINYFMRPSTHDALLQQEIAKQYQPITGQALQSASPLFQTLMYLRQAAQGGPR